MSRVHLTVDFSLLEKAVRQMGRPVSREKRVVDLGDPEWQPLDGKLVEGMGIELEKLDTTNGFLSYEGRQVALYIPDHGRRVQDALGDGTQGNRIHVADCQTLQEMRKKNRYERYVMTTSTRPTFPVSGVDREKHSIAVNGKAALSICKNCLKFLRYKGYTGGNSVVWRDFSLVEFYEIYQTFFPVMPRRWAGSQEGYAEKWEEISKRFRESKSWTCEACRVDLSDEKRLLHTHHKNGVKSDNSLANLKAVCCSCHRREPHHEHMRVSPEDTKRIQLLRREQGILKNLNWLRVRDFAEPGVEGAVRRLQDEGAEIPELGVQVGDKMKQVVAEPELAYSSKRLGIAISPKDRTEMERAGWQALAVHEVTDPERHLPDSIRPRPFAHPA